MNFFDWIWLWLWSFFLDKREFSTLNNQSWQKNDYNESWFCLFDRIKVNLSTGSMSNCTSISKQWIYSELRSNLSWFAHVSLKECWFAIIFAILSLVLSLSLYKCVFSHQRQRNSLFCSHKKRHTYFLIKIKA